MVSARYIRPRRVRSSMILGSAFFTKSPANDPGPVLDRDEVRVDDEEGRFVGDQVGVERLVAGTEQALRVDLGLDLVLALQHRQPGPGQDVTLISLADADVGDV